MAEESQDCSEIPKVPGSSAMTSSSSDPNLTMAEASHPWIREVLALTSAGGIVIINLGTQGDIVMGVGGDVIKDVHGNIIKGNIVKDVQGNIIRVPNFVVLKSKYRGKFLRLTENDGSLPEGFLKFEGGKVATEQAKFELVPEESGKGLVHLRCCYNNKYLVRYINDALGTACSSGHWIVAAADKPEENKFSTSCTLFKMEPVNISEGLEFRFRHIQLNLHACLWTCSKPDHHRNFGGLHGGSGAPDKDEFNVYTVVAWESLANKMNTAAMVPLFVEPKLLKSMYNNNYLSLTENGSHLPAGFLKFNGEELASPLAKFEVEMENNENGLVHIRCCYNDKYLVTENTPIDSGCNNNKYWIVAAADKPEKDDNKISCTLFKLEPVNIEGLEFRFFHIQLEKHACLWTCSKPAHIRYFGGLHGGSGAPDKDVFNVYTVVAWELLERKINKTVLPRFAALKSMYNNKYLSLTKNDPLLPAGFLKFDGEEVASPLVKFEVEKAKIGNRWVHIRCCYNKKYLVRENTPIGACCYNNKHWIVAAADKPEEDKYKISCTLFEPEPYDGSGGLEFRFRHVQLGTYACLWRMKNHIPFVGGLYAGSNVPDKDVCDVFILRE